MALAEPQATAYSGRFGRYEVLFPLASGGMGQVFAARAHGAAAFQKLVALKTIRAELTRDEALVGRFENEGRYAANISSPYVAQTLDFGVATDGTLYLVMEFVLGASLRDLMRDVGGLLHTPLPILLKVLGQVAQGLHDAHRACDANGNALDLIHRDLSPHNIIVGTDGRSRIVDFGVARALRGDSMTRTGEVVGKIGYFSPEQLTGARVDQRSDVFALGVIAWELLTGQRLFYADSAYEGIAKVIEAPIVDVRTHRADIPAEVWDVVRRSLARPADQRVPSAAAFAHDLSRAAQQGVGLATEVEVGQWARNRGAARVDELERCLRGAQQPSDPNTNSEKLLWEPPTKAAPVPSADATASSRRGRTRRDPAARESGHDPALAAPMPQAQDKRSQAQGETASGGQLRPTKSPKPRQPMPEPVATAPASAHSHAGHHTRATQTTQHTGLSRVIGAYFYARNNWLFAKAMAIVALSVASMMLLRPHYHSPMRQPAESARRKARAQATAKPTSDRAAPQPDRAHDAQRGTEPSSAARRPPAQDSPASHSARRRAPRTAAAQNRSGGPPQKAANPQRSQHAADSAADNASANDSGETSDDAPVPVQPQPPPEASEGHRWLRGVRSFDNDLRKRDAE